MSGSHLSKEFFDVVKAIGEAKSKQEEDRIIVNEVKLLKSRFQEKSLSKKTIKESLVRLIYVEMLGHDASFAYVHAIQLTASGDLMQKRVGYLCASLTLSPEHEFRFMLVNQLQRDLASANILEVSAALIALSKLITGEMIPALLPSVTKVLSHDDSVIRKKAILALHRIYQLDPGAVSHLTETFRRVLCDKDPSVMGASLCILHELAKEDVQSQKDLVSSYVSILKQIVEHRLPKDFDYHRIPAPWLQIKLLKILACLGENDQRTSEQMYEVLHECMKRANTGIYVGYAIIYECVRTVTTIYPNPVLLDAAAGAIARFIQSESHNLKYLGVTGLASVVRDHPRYAAEHQMIVLDCLEDPDETLKRKTLDLLFRMTNPVNAEVVVDKLVHFLKGAVDKYLRQDLVVRICQLAERFAPSNIWYVRTMAKVFELGGDLVDPEHAHSLLRLLAEGVGDDEDDDADDAMRREACEIFYDLFERPILPEILLRVMFWTLGEYAYLMGADIVPEVLEVICEAASRQGMAPETRGYAVSAVMKMCAQIGRLTPEAAELIDRYSSSVDTDLQQKCYEFREIARNSNTLVNVLPVDASCEDLSDPDFSFLEPFVEAARASGAPDYSPPTQDELDSYEQDQDRNGTKPVVVEPTLKYDAYEKPAPPSQYLARRDPTPTQNVQLDYGASAGSGGASGVNGGGTAATLNAGGLNLHGVKSVWGAQGYANANSLRPGPVNTVLSMPSKSSPPPAEVEETGGNAHEDGYTIPREPTPPPPAQEAASSYSIPEKPKELTEREKMAAALFGGVVHDDSSAIGMNSSSNNSSSISNSSGARRKPRNVDTSAEKPPDAAPPAPSPVNLLDFGDDTGGYGSPKNNDTTSVDLLAELGGGFSVEPASMASTASAEFDLLGGGGGEVDVMSGDAAPPSAQPPPFSQTSMTTQDFGQRWVSSPAEMKFSVTLQQVSSIQDIVSRIESKIGLKVVEVIAATEEAIFAGMDQGNVVLLHAKRRMSIPAGADIIIRSTMPNVASKAQTFCQTLLR